MDLETIQEPESRCQMPRRAASLRALPEPSRRPRIKLEMLRCYSLE
jgi:hypothetical protein